MGILNCDKVTYVFLAHATHKMYRVINANVIYSWAFQDDRWGQRGRYVEQRIKRKTKTLKYSNHEETFHQSNVFCLSILRSSDDNNFDQVCFMTIFNGPTPFFCRPKTRVRVNTRDVLRVCASACVQQHSECQMSRVTPPGKLIYWMYTFQMFLSLSLLLTFASCMNYANILLFFYFYSKI